MCMYECCRKFVICFLVLFMDRYVNDYSNFAIIQNRSSNFTASLNIYIFFFLIEFYDELNGLLFILLFISEYVMLLNFTTSI